MRNITLIGEQEAPIHIYGAIRRYNEDLSNVSGSILPQMTDVNACILLDTFVITELPTHTV